MINSRKPPIWFIIRRVTHFFLSPQFINGVFPTPCVRVIDNVIVHQAGSVDHLRDHGDRALRRQQNPEDIRCALLTLTDASHTHTALKCVLTPLYCCGRYKLEPSRSQSLVGRLFPFHQSNNHRVL